MKNYEMRRANLEADESTSKQILVEGSYGILSTVGEDGFPYGVPVNYAYDGDKIYFHCAKNSGHKQYNILFSDKVCFTVVTDSEVLAEKLDTKYKSVVVFGTAKKSDTNREHAFKQLLKKYAPEFSEFDNKEHKSECKAADIYEINILKLSGKIKHQG